MVASLRDAKARLSELVQKAANGEGVVITVRGEPVVKLSPIRSKEVNMDDRTAWAAELAEAAKAASVDPQSTTDQKVWDELREDRI